MTENRRRGLPPWLKVRLPSDQGELKRVARVLRRMGLHTVCTAARCPNIAECWGCGTATVMILGKECTRNCRFCAVQTSRSPSPPDPAEPARVSEMVLELKLRYVVITSVTRDDLPDQGAKHFAATVHEIRRRCPGTRVELLIPDFRGDERLLEVIVRAGADVVGHNLETVRRLTPLVRDPRTSYDRSLSVLWYLSSHRVVTKTAFLLGLGETREELLESFADARSVGVQRLALGQYLAPSVRHVPVARYLAPEEFDELAEAARSFGFTHVASGPFVRSSYKAGEE